MEAWNNYNIKGYNLMVWFFRLLLLFAVTIILLLFFLEINESVAIKEGQVLGKSPQVNYIAAHEAEVLKTHVREGQSVKKGDTLMQLQNLDLLQQQAKTAAEIAFLKTKLSGGNKASTNSAIDYEKQLMLSAELMKKIEHDIRKLTVITAVNGAVNYLFNTVQSNNFIEKGELLVSVAPEVDSYYAKAVISEKDISSVKPGQIVYLKVNAHAGSKESIMGKITYVSELKQNDQFFVLVDLPQSKQLQLRTGYSIYGHVNMQRLPLYQYFIKKLFKK